MRMTIPQDTVALRTAAARVVERLALTGYNNESIEKVDAWVGSPEFNGDADGVEAGAYLGEAIIKRHGGKWSFGDGAPQVVIDRNGIHIINPFGKIAKRVENGREDHLISLVELAGHVSKETKHERQAVVQQAADALGLMPQGGSIGVGKLLFAVIVVPVVVLVALLVALGMSQLWIAAVGAVVSIPLAVFLLAKLAGGPKSPRVAPGTLGWEAQLSMNPLAGTLLMKLDELGAEPRPKQLEEIAFYAAQLRKLAAIVARGDTRPGRGYVGFDTFDKPTSSWPD